MLNGFKRWLWSGLLLFSVEGHAMWAKMSEAQLLEYSQLIITGEFLGESEIHDLTKIGTVNLGVIRVDKILKGKVEGTLVFLALPSGEQPKASSSINYSVGTKGLWYLRHRSEGGTIYLADHPQRFIDEASASEYIIRLQQQPTK